MIWPILPPKTIYKCKHCHVQIISKFDFRPILGREHGKKCPRRRLNG
jgi:hypothetical protein